MRPRLPQRAHGAAVERAGLRQGRAADPDAAPMPPVPPGAGWVTYVRCHDDIGWAITEEDAGAVGEDAHLHRRFLSDFYAGDFPGSFARGARFQLDPRSGEARTSGTTASLAGLEAALADGDDVARGARGAPHPAPLRGRLRPRRPAAHLHGRRARACATTARGATTPPGATTTAGCTGRRWTGRRPRGAHDPGHGRGAAVGGPATAGRGAPRARPRCTPRARWSRCGPATSTSSASLRDARGRRGCCCWPTSPPARSGVRLALADEHGLAARRPTARAPDGRPLRAPRRRARARALPVRLAGPLRTV